VICSLRDIPGDEHKSDHFRDQASGDAMKHHTRKAMIRDSWDRTRPDILTAERIEVALQLQRMIRRRHCSTC